jgi:hypothetical protein
MMSDVLCVAYDPLVAYIDRCGGQDILVFDTANQASDAAHRVRKRSPELHVEARYDKVFLRTRRTNA